MLKPLELTSLRDKKRALCDYHAFDWHSTRNEKLAVNDRVALGVDVCRNII
jgi:hypothetical protein